ncbi:ferrochelatase [Thalassoroseus pseudoceratinae]|uniref:ferrochelatase n=1 Tax=Thalassoroseus pseudoceratinae TaxID=2713176 RepID=UPI00141EA06B|nr:ferrochelatase [Thalassoroseus pseudoceratinae]
MNSAYDAILLIGFGGPEGPDDVIPFLENVLRGRNVPRERMLEVAEHYNHFGGVSPINGQVRELMDALRPELESHGVDLPMYWGNRNWHPMLTDTMQSMKDDGIQKALGLVLAAYSSYSSCRQYREDVAKSQDAVGDGVPEVDKIRVFYNHPLFIDANVDRVRHAMNAFAASSPASDIHIAFTAHSIPMSMANHCNYERQLQETCRLVAESLEVSEDRWQLVYQSRSGRPQDPWLEPDILDHIQQVHDEGVQNLVVMPIGFLSDHMEVLFDLDEEAQEKADELGMQMVRAKSVGTHPKFVQMLRELIQERLDSDIPRRAIGEFGPNHDVCPVDCCPAPARPQRR